MKKTFVFLSLLICTIAYAEPNKKEWRWHYISFESPVKSEEIFIRSGLALTKQTNNKIEIHFIENNFSESKPILIGKISKNKIDGQLKNFFMYEEDLELFGLIRFKKFDKNCAFEEVVLQTKQLTGSVLILSRVVGDCQ